MNKKFFTISAVLLVAGVAIAWNPFSKGPTGHAKVGEPAPVFNVIDMAGKAYRLEDFKGKFLVLEWYNQDCPYVRKHYDAKNMQGLQAEFTAKGVEWVAVISSAKGKQGHLDGAGAMAQMQKEGFMGKTVLLDADGKMGNAYGAKTTPHMFIINPEGKLIYNGAIDDNDSANPKVIATSKNFVRVGLNSALKGEAIATSSTKPYGCSVKY